MSKVSADSDEVFGCILAIWVLLVTTPMWFAIMYGVLKSLGDGVPMWVWVTY